MTEEELLFHYRHPRKRRLIENVFGIRIDRFRIFGIRATLTPARLVIIVTLELHNFLRLKPSDSDRFKDCLNEIQSNR